MSILRSLTTSVSGLKATGAAIGITADNIANAGTTGFKSSRGEFQDLLAKSLTGVEGANQIGSGSTLAHVKPNFVQGNVTRTENVTDVAINGNGFFQVKTPFGLAYTRDGSFQFNKDGALVNGDGYPVHGFQGNADGVIVNKVGPLVIGNTTIPAKGTEKVNINMNFDSRADVKQFDPLRPEETSNFNSSMTVYDNIGTARLVTLYFNKTAENNWQYRAMVDGKDAAGGEEGKLVEMGSGTVSFTDKGVLQNDNEQNMSFNFNNGAKPGQAIEFNFGESVTEGGDGSQASTQYGAPSSVARHTQDGYAAAGITSLSLSDDGVLDAIFSNGEAKSVGQLAIAKFENMEGLTKLGKNLLRETRKSGQAALGRPAEGGRGEVLSKSLELSNVDMATEFVNLMTGQRNFQANAKSINTADQMLQEILSLKR